MTKPISRWPVPDVADLPEDLRARILEVQAKAGFVPNVFLAFAHRPAEARAFFDWHDALMLRDSPTLSRAEREMIIVATSAANDCLYCVVAHGALLRVYAKQPLLADQVAVNYLKADISERQRAMLAFALNAAQRRVPPARSPAARKEGLSRAGHTGVKPIVMSDGTRPSVSRGRVSVRSIARSTASSQSLLPLDLTSRRPRIVPSGPARTSTSARSVAGTDSVR